MKWKHKPQYAETEAAMSNHLFNLNPIDFTKEPLFLGTGRNISRLDLSIEPHITKMHNDALGKLWFGGDFSPSKDAKSYMECSIELNSLYMKNLKFQTLLDAVAGRSVAEVFLPITTNPQLASWWYQHAFFEDCIHSQSYADILKGLPVDAKAIFDDIMINPNILRRAASITACFEDTVQHNCRMILKDPSYNKELHKKSIVMSLYALNILEAVLFKSSFLTSFAFKENGLYSVTADIVSKIAQDESGHYAMTINLLNRLRKDPDWAYIFHTNSDQIGALYQSALDADYLWIDYLFEDGARLLGLNAAVAKQYVTHNLHSVMISVGHPPIVEKVQNPCVWANKYTRPSSIQTAQKEKTSGNYLLGVVNTNTTPEFWSSL
jgi:ribonucleoside-diphosphate reductase beta chain